MARAKGKRKRKQDSPDLMATRPEELLVLAEQGYEDARLIDNQADRSKEMRGWWDRRLTVLQEYWRFERVERLEAMERGDVLAEEDVNALRTRVEGESAPQAGRGEVLQ